MRGRGAGEVTILHQTPFPSILSFCLRLTFAAEVPHLVVDPPGFFGDLFAFAILAPDCTAVGLLKQLSARRAANKVRFALCTTHTYNLLTWLYVLLV